MMQPDGKPRGGLSRFEREKLLSGLESRDAGSLGEADRNRLEEERAAGEAFLARHPDLESLEAKAAAARVTPPRARILAFRKPMAYALAACLALLIAPAVLLRLPLSRTGGEDATLKGGAFFMLRINGKAADKSGPISAGPGDTLQFLLHHPSPARYALYYRDDAGPWQTYLEPRPAARERAPEGEPAAHGIILEPGWAEERIAAVAAPGASGGDWKPCLEADPGARPEHCRELHVEFFRLINPEKPSP